MKKVYIKTFGCQMNEYDSDKMADVLRAAEGYEPTSDVEQADLVLFNTCSVREKAQEKVFSDLGRVKHLKARGVMIGVGGTKLALFKAAASPASEGSLPLCRWHRVAWQTDGAGFEAAQHHLASLRISFRGPVDHGSAWSIYFHDPDGNLLEITHYLAAL